ncbi:hypothetical protein AAZX31_19G054300 [Glycine max]
MISLINYIRIFYKKVEYVLEDCNEVLVKINKFFVNKEGLVCVETLCMPVTIPERFELDAFELDKPEDAGRYIVRKSIIKECKRHSSFPFPTECHHTLLIAHCTEAKRISHYLLCKMKQIHVELYNQSELSSGFFPFRCDSLEVLQTSRK